VPSAEQPKAAKDSKDAADYQARVRLLRDQLKKLREDGAKAI
jgi:ribosomal protein L19E